MSRTQTAHEPFPGELAAAVRADGAGSVGLDPRLAVVGFEAEDVIGADVQQRQCFRAAVSREVTDAERIHGERAVGFVFGLVDEVVGGTVHDGVGPQLIQNSRHGCGVGEFDLRVSQREAALPEERHQIAAELSKRAEDGDALHAELLT
jgi:hypothetical protein